MEIVKTCKSEGVLLQVCHVLRYSPWAMKIKEIIDSGRIGDVVNIQHLEPVSIQCGESHLQLRMVQISVPQDIILYLFSLQSINIDIIDIL